MSEQQTEHGEIDAASGAASEGEDHHGVVIGILVCVLAALIAFFVVHTLT